MHVYSDVSSIDLNEASYPIRLYKTAALGQIDTMYLNHYDTTLNHHCFSQRIVGAEVC